MMLLRSVAILRSRVLSNAAALLMVQAANMLLPLITIPYLLRVLGPAEFGRIVLSQAIVGYLLIVVDYGFALSATRRVAMGDRSVETVSQILANVTAIKIMLASGSAFLLVVAISVPFSPLRPLAETLYAALPVLLGSILFPQWLFQGLERMLIITVAVLIAKSLVVPLTFLLVRTADDAWLAALVSSGTTVLAGLVSLMVIAKFGIARWRMPSLAVVRDYLTDGWHYFISIFATSLYSQSNSILLGAVSSVYQVGIFGAADKLRQASVGIIPPLNNAAYPRISALMATDPAQAWPRIRMLFLIMAGVCGMVSLTLLFGAPLIVDLLMGERFQASVLVLQLMSPLPLLVGMNTILGVQCMLPMGMKRAFSRIILVAGACNVAMMLVLAGRYGASGAAGALLLTELGVTTVMALTVRKAYLKSRSHGCA